MSDTTSPAQAPRRILGATLAAFLAAAVALVAFVLPAEYGLDPLGTGAAMGLTALAEPEREVVEAAAAPYVPETVRFELQPFESVEYKYRLEQGDTLVYSWRASADVVSELHAEPDDAPEGFAESYDRSRVSAHHGSYHAAFAGWHGWFWENRSADVVTVTLDAAGFFSAARIYRGGRVWEQDKAAPGARAGEASGG